MTRYRSLVGASLTLALLTLGSSLSGCSDSGGLEAAANKPPSWLPGSDPDGFIDKTTGDTDSANNIPQKQRRIVVEATAAMLGTTASDDKLIAVPNTQIAIYRVGPSLSPASLIPFTSTTQADGSYLVTLDAVYQTDIDLLVEAQLPNGEIMRAPLADADQNIFINPFSESYVRNVLGELSPSAWGELVGCPSTDCQSLNLFPGSVDAAQRFEISIKSTYGLDTALGFLQDQGGFQDFLSALREGLEVPKLDVENVTTALGLNSVLFSLEMNSNQLPSTAPDTLLGTRIQTVGSRTGNGVTVKEYAEATFGSFGSTDAGIPVTGLRFTTISTNSPFQRLTLEQTTTNQLIKKSSWQVNAHSAAPGGAIIANTGMVYAGRSAYQTITNDAGAPAWGWAPDPYFLRAYLFPTTTAPVGLLSSYFESGKVFSLTGTSGDYQRGRALEVTNLFHYDLQLKQSSNYAMAGIAGKTYGVVSFAARLSEGSASQVASVATKTWSATGTTVTETYGNGADHDTEQVLTRSNSGAVTNTVTSAIGGDTLAFTALVDEVAAATITTASRGRISYTGANESGIGAALPDSSLLAIAMNSSRSGQGIQLATEITGAATSICGGTYRLQGTSFGMTTDENFFRSYGGSTLTIGADAQLSLSRIESQQNRNTFSIINGHVIDTTPTTGADAINCALTGQKISLAFANIDGDGATLELTGYASADGKLLFLKLVQGNQVGMLMGFRDRS